ncbi:MAG: cupin domain-containing protein [Sphingobium sp.]
MNVSIGDRLRYVRTKHDISQRELAKRTGIANSTISLIESNSTNPSVAALKRILAGIPICMAEFFTLEPRAEQVFYRPHEMLEIGKGNLSLKRIGNANYGRSLQMLKECYEPGADTGRVMLCHDGEEAGLVLSGVIEVTVGNERRLLKAGDSYYFDSRTPHRFRCVGPEACEIVSASTPPTF